MWLEANLDLGGPIRGAVPQGGKHFYRYSRMVLSSSESLIHVLYVAALLAY